MKVLTLLSTTVYSSHYRGGTYIFKSNADGTTSIQQTQTYNARMAGTGAFCTKAFEGQLADELADNVETTCLQYSDPKLLSDPSFCPTSYLRWPYIVGFSSNGEMGGDNDYCYGSYDQNMPTPSTGYKIGWSGGNWVPMNDDFGNTVNFYWGSMEVHATIDDPTNNSPVFTHPPIWRIMSGCDGQKIDLSPVDPDGDTVKCRWSETYEEGGAAQYQPAAWPSLSLDGDNCIVHYTGSIDQTRVGVKGVGIMMEDFDQNGKRKSSIPVQFLAAVWTPQSSARGVALPFVYPDWFADDDHHHDDMDNDHEKPSKEKKRGRRTATPSYCSAVPVIVPPSPADGSIETGQSFEITLKAESDGGTIKSFSFEKPALMSCSSPDKNGAVTCTWTPTDSDKKTEDNGFCFLATDTLGLTTERRCITLRIPSKPSCSATSCHQNATCTNTSAGFTCNCPDGYRGDGINECEDRDECAEESHTCHTNATCKNTDGSYNCECNAGWQDNGIKCENIDECAANTHTCDTNATCKDTAGSYNCECNKGWRGDGFSCTNIDECEEKTHNCHGLARCLDTPGSFDCKCLDGYEGDGVRKCRDINECARKIHDCDINATCDNTVGSYNCSCNGSCHDNGTCNHNNIGWRGDGFKCNNIDECEEKTHNCHGFATCSDTLGSFECECFDGYRGDGVKKCDEIDECAEGTDECHDFATCTNTPPGSYTCDCFDGYEGDGFNCTDIDECATDTHDCHVEFGLCTNTPGSYDCTCNDGYMGDGFLCTVPCATFYDTARDGFLTNTTAFTTGTFDVTNLETFATTPSQTGLSNWKPSAGFNNKASYVSVQPRCTLQGYTGMNFRGKKLGEWNGKFYIILRYE